MAETTLVTDLQNVPRSPMTVAKDAWRMAPGQYERQAASYAVDRGFDPVSIGLWLGGIAYGAAGCILGSCMPYSRPVGVLISVIWWGIYIGCFGAGIGAGVGGLVSRWKKRSAITLPRRRWSGVVLKAGKWDGHIERDSSVCSGIRRVSAGISCEIPANSAANACRALLFFVVFAAGAGML